MRSLARALAVAGIAVLALTGCSPSGGQVTERDTYVASNWGRTASVLSPGDVTATAGVVPHRDGASTTFFEHRVSSIVEATAEQSEMIWGAVPDYDGLKMHLVEVVSTYVSGDITPGAVLASSFRPVDENLAEMRMLTLDSSAGFCPRGAVLDPQDGIETVSCMVAVQDHDGVTPAGVAWTQKGSEYEWFTGAPAFFMAG